MIVYTSQNNHALTNNPAILGEAITIDYFEGKIGEGTVCFKLNKSYAEKASQTSNLDYQGLKKYYVFVYNKNNDVLVPVPTSYDEISGTVKGQMTGTYCIMDVEDWFLDIGALQESQHVESLAQSDREESFEEIQSIPIMMKTFLDGKDEQTAPVPKTRKKRADSR